MLESFDDAGISFDSERSKPGYSNAKFKCKKCSWSFDRRVALIWLTTANKIGEEKAITEYQKMRDENT
jgi:hypothetical protein